jgi:pSer/pThr/pTyr-binding forkhead associated (FHA) protein
MPASVLAILKVVFLIVLYLFIARVVRAVWVEIFAERRTLAENVPSGTGPSQKQLSKRDAKAQAAAEVAASQPRGRKEKKAAKKASVAYGLKVVEPPDQRGHKYGVLEEMTIGRAEGCAISVIDTFASQLHARVFKRDGQVFVEDLGSTNGTFLNRKRVAGPMPMSAGDRLQVGDTVMELVKS